MVVFPAVTDFCYFLSSPSSANRRVANKPLASFSISPSTYFRNYPLSSVPLIFTSKILCCVFHYKHFCTKLFRFFISTTHRIEIPAGGISRPRNWILINRVRCKFKIVIPKRKQWPRNFIKCMMYIIHTPSLKTMASGRRVKVFTKCNVGMNDRGREAGNSLFW